ncbi:SRPBCC family protein [Gloeobacter kilaueensis]|uniref:Cyclase/dehydrase n=1 Tax=Gloeobacter kilaueensis (strain ATCC BAA-2537 / CCAP 1431/1 / ULC 316 / JS1) TaxID=1183438 RepID=U5QN43_GLOK1|nr:SRPBCC family protein [Gloeobacter kilaueensis]AGY59024.1 cyclase/dehydrase [Gloeobacter kilaueensis JS1]
MIERSIEVEVAAPLAAVYAIWADLENLPRWMRFVKSVRILPGTEDLSRWQFGLAAPLVVEWTSRITRRIPLRLIAWESVSGLTNRGSAEFFPTERGCRLKLTLSFDSPSGLAGEFLQRLGVERWVDENLIDDLRRFQSLVEQDTPRQPVA